MSNKNNALKKIIQWEMGQKRRDLFCELKN